MTRYQPNSCEITMYYIINLDRYKIYLNLNSNFYFMVFNLNVSYKLHYNYPFQDTKKYNKVLSNQHNLDNKCVFYTQQQSERILHFYVNHGLLAINICCSFSEIGVVGVSNISLFVSCVTPAGRQDKLDKNINTWRNNVTAAWSLKKSNQTTLNCFLLVYILLVAWI